MLDISKFRKGVVVCHRFTWRRYRVVSVERARVLVVPVECRDSSNPIWSNYHIWFDSRLLEFV